MRDREMRSCGGQTQRIAFATSEVDLEQVKTHVSELKLDVFEEERFRCGVLAQILVPKR
jgi:hypothetical protein